MSSSSAVGSAIDDSGADLFHLLLKDSALLSFLWHPLVLALTVAICC